MSTALNNIELIEKYCEGKLSVVEKSDFENRLLIDSDFKEEFELYKIIVEEIKKNGEDNLKARLKIADLELDSFPSKVIELNKNSNYRKYLGIAASVVLIIGLALFWKFSSSEDLPKLADSYYEKDKGLPVQMSNTKIETDELMNAYKSQDYKIALEQLDVLLQKTPKNDTINYYFGVVNYELGNYDVSKSTLNSIVPESYYYEKAQYRLVLIELKINNKQGAIDKIDSCLKNKNHLYYNKLTQLKEDLSK